MKPKLWEWFCARKTLSSLAVFMTLMGVGLITAAFGPALPLLSAQTNSTTETVSWLFTGQSIGYLIGTLISGPLLDKVRREGVLLGSTIVLAGLCNCAVPFPRGIGVLIALCVLQGISFGALDCGGQVAILRLHGASVGPWMAAMHFFYAAGTTVSPFIVGAVIASTGGLVVSFIVLGVLTALTGLLLVPTPPFKEGSAENKKPRTSPPPPAESPNGIEVDAVAASSSSSSSSTEPPAPKKEVSDPQKRPQMRRAVFWTIVVLAGVFLLVYATIEVTWGSFVATYAVQTNTTNVVDAAYATAAFWGSFCLGRLINIPLALVVPPEIMIFVSLVGCALSITPLLIWTGVGVLWAVACVYGVFMGPIWASLWSTLGKFVEVSGKAATVVEIGSSLGNIAMPVTIGALITRIGPQVLPIQQLISVFADIAVLIAIMLVLRLCTKPYSELETSPTTTPQLEEAVDVVLVS